MAFLKKQENSQMDNQTYHLKELWKEYQEKPKVSRREEITTIREEINKRDKKTVGKINETKSCFSEKINKIDKPLARIFIKKKTERTQISKIRNEKREITTNTTEIQKKS